MARRPVVLPKWATHPYGGDDLAWQEAVRQCRQALLTWAREGQPHYYSELVPLVSAIPWPEGAHTHEGQQLGYLLGQVSLEELDPDEDRPLLSAMVIGRETNMPSGGFWALLQELGVKVGPSWEQRQEFWLRELRRCAETYSTSSS
jgi:hypothetical protein